jgi:hypothetical protein
MAYYRVHNSPPLVPLLSQMNLLHIVKPKRKVARQFFAAPIVKDRGSNSWLQERPACCLLHAFFFAWLILRP